MCVFRVHADKWHGRGEPAAYYTNATGLSQKSQHVAQRQLALRLCGRNRRGPSCEIPPRRSGALTSAPRANALPGALRFHCAVAGPLCCARIVRPAQLTGSGEASPGCVPWLKINFRTCRALSSHHRQHTGSTLDAPLEASLDARRLACDYISGSGWRLRLGDAIRRGGGSSAASAPAVRGSVSARCDY